MTDTAYLNATLYHASTRQGLVELHPAASDPDNVFGPAIYASSERSVAEAQGSKVQSIYLINAFGPINQVIELDHSIAYQDYTAREAIERVCRRYQITIQPSHDEAMSHWLAVAAMELQARGVSYPPRTLINRALADEGIWLMRGTVDGYEHAGHCDDGIQWCILKTGHANIVNEQPPYLAAEMRA